MASGLEVEQKMRKRGKWLCRAGWAAFAASLLLPSIFVKIMGDGDWWPGWHCAWFSATALWGVLTQQEGWQDGWLLYYAGFGVTNSAMLLSPLIHRWLRGDRRRMRRWAAVVAAAALYTLSYAVLGVGGDGTYGLHAGFYAWQMSFPLLTFGALHLAMKREDARPSQISSNRSISEEELVALAELEEYLGATARPPIPRAYGEEVRAVEPQQNVNSKLTSPFAFIRVHAG